MFKKCEEFFEATLKQLCVFNLKKQKNPTFPASLFYNCAMGTKNELDGEPMVQTWLTLDTIPVVFLQEHFNTNTVLILV